MTIHKELAAGRWHTLTLFEQLGNVGSDVDRALSWKKRGDFDASERALLRALELLNLTLTDPKHQEKKGRLKELFRTREVLLDYFYGDNQYGYTDDALSRYFYNYALTAALQKGL